MGWADGTWVPNPNPKADTYNPDPKADTYLFLAHTAHCSGLNDETAVPCKLQLGLQFSAEGKG